MKNFNQFILTLLAAGLFASCSLTEEPTSFVNRKSFYKNESQCIAALNSCYMPANAIYTANFMLVTEACTDIWYSSSTTVDACLDVTPAKPQYGKNVWTQGYKGVMYCNECVECISSADLADGVKMPLAAEARVMRAFYYYVLTCMFGDVPFYTTMVDTDQRLAEIRRLPRTPAHEIRQELYDDLERNALPWFTAENGRKCRASEAVDNRSGYALALMLMAKFAMWNEDWNGALVPLQALEELYGDFNEGNYPLAETQWRYKNPAESIFEIQHAWSLTGTQYNGNVAAIMMPTHNGDGVFDGVPLKGYGTSMPRLVVAAGQQPLCDLPPRDGQYADRECGLRRRAVQPPAPDLRHLRRDAEPLYGEDRPRGAGRRGDPRAEDRPPRAVLPRPGRPGGGRDLQDHAQLRSALARSEILVSGHRAELRFEQLPHFPLCRRHSDDGRMLLQPGERRGDDALPEHGPPACGRRSRHQLHGLRGPHAGLSAASAPGSWAASSSASSTSCAGASGTTRPTPIPTTRRSRARCAPATATIPFPTRSAPFRATC